MASKAKASIVRERALKAGYRSGLEEDVSKDLSSRGIMADYEAISIPYCPPSRLRRYTPDFVLPNGIIVETKGQFVTDDRTKHKNIKAEHPELDVRFVFSNSRNKLSKVSRTTYAAWCRQYGFLFADRRVPQEWIEEPPCPRRIAALARIAVPARIKKPSATS